MNPETQIRINMLNIKDYVNIRFSSRRYSTKETYESIRNLNIKIGLNFQQAIYKIDNSFDFNYEPSKESLRRFRDKYITK